MRRTFGDVLDSLPAFQLYVIASMGLALVVAALQSVLP